MRIFNSSVLLVLLSLPAIAQNYEISKWYNSKKACLVLTYDDMFTEHLTLAGPHLIARNMGGTLFMDNDYPGNLNAGGGFPVLKTLVDGGIEVANHTFNHSNVKSLFTSNAMLTLQQEVNDFRDYIDANVTNQTCNTFAYPFGEGWDEPGLFSFLKENHIGARAAWYIGGGSWNYSQNWIYNFANTWKEYYYIPTKDINGFLTDFDKDMANVFKYGGLITIMFHGVPGNHEQILDDINAFSDSLWVPTFRDAILYHKERHCATLQTTQETSTEWHLELSDTLSDNVYNHPLTLKLKVGNRVINEVKQNGQSLSFSTNHDTLVFNAIPDGGDIIIEKTGGSSIADADNKNFTLFPNPAHDHLQIQTAKNTDLSTVKIYSQIGILVNEFNHLENTKNYNLALNNLSAGTYIVELSDKNGGIQRSLIVIQ